MSAEETSTLDPLTVEIPPLSPKKKKKKSKIPDSKISDPFSSPYKPTDNYDFNLDFINNNAGFRDVSAKAKSKRTVGKALRALLTGGGDVTKNAIISDIFYEPPKRIKKYSMANHQINDVLNRKKNQKKIILDDYAQRKTAIETKLKKQKQLEKFAPVIQKQLTIEKKLGVLSAHLNEVIKFLSAIEMLNDQETRKLTVREQKLLMKEDFYRKQYDILYGQIKTLKGELKSLHGDIVHTYKQKDFATKYDDTLRNLYDQDDNFGTNYGNLLSENTQNKTIEKAEYESPAKNYYTMYENEKKK